MDHNRLISLLKKHFGYSSFRSLQLEIIGNIINSQDCIALLPTGGGKSLCYQLPCVYLKSKCLVISPLIALMEDQVIGLKEKSIPAFLLHSGMNKAEMATQCTDFYDSGFGILYVSPERLFNEDFIEFIKKIILTHIAIDEAHCISQWGHDFRPSYLQIGKFVERLENRPQLIALTATATKRSLDDIIRFTGLESPEILRSGFYRDNIDIGVQFSTSSINRLLEIKSNKSVSSEIVYSRSRRGVKTLSEKLKSSGYSSSFYHGNLPYSVRKSISQQWKNGIIKTIVATNAFGMGIDKSNVYRVIHLNIPPSIEEYYQEIGRAGRDGKNSEAFMILDNDAVSITIEKWKNGIILQEDWEKFNKGFSEFANGFTSDLIYPIIIRNLSRKIGIHPFKIVKCLEIYQKAGKMHVSEGVLNPSRVMFISSKVRNEVFHLKGELKYLVADHLLKSFEYLFDGHVVIIEEQIADSLDIELSQVENSLLELSKEGLLSYQKRKSIPYIRLIDTAFSNYSIEFVQKAQENSKSKLDSMINFIESDQCRMQLLMEYFDELSDPCMKCDNCMQKKNNKSDYEIFFSRLHDHHHGEFHINQELIGINPTIKRKIISRLKILENEGLIEIDNGRIIMRKINKS